MIINSTIYGAAAPPPIELVSEMYMLWPQDIITDTTVEFHRSDFTPFMFTFYNASRYSENSNDMLICGTANTIDPVSNFYYVAKKDGSSSRLTLSRRRFNDVVFFDDGFKFILDGNDTGFLVDAIDNFAIYVYGKIN